MLKEIDRHTNALSKLVEGLGFPKEQAEKALRECNDDVALASERLLRKQSEAGASQDPPYFSEAPPPYSEVELNPSSLKPPPYMKHDTAALLGEMKAQLNSDPEERCSSCFDPIRPDPSEGFSGNIVWKGLKAYHSECYLKSKGPKCEHCCFALIPYPDKGLSGQWGIYDGHRFHEECYIQYAGPRCSRCFDVIATNSEKGFSGLWIQEQNKQYHEECYKMKLQALLKAKQA